MSFKQPRFLRAGFCLFFYGFVFQMPPRRSTRSKRPSSQALESLVASPPRRRRTATPSLPSSGNNSETAAQSAVFLPGPSSHASEPAIQATGPAFSPALFSRSQLRSPDSSSQHPFCLLFRSPKCHLLPLLLFLA